MCLAANGIFQSSLVMSSHVLLTSLKLGQIFQTHEIQPDSVKQNSLPPSLLGCLIPDLVQGEKQSSPSRLEFSEIVFLSDASMVPDTHVIPCLFCSQQNKLWDGWQVKSGSFVPNTGLQFGSSPIRKYCIPFVCKIQSQASDMLLPNWMFSFTWQSLILGNTHGLQPSNSPDLPCLLRINSRPLTTASKVWPIWPSPSFPVSAPNCLPSSSCQLRLYIILKHSQPLPAPGFLDVCSLSLWKPPVQLLPELPSSFLSIHAGDLVIIIITMLDVGSDFFTGLASHVVDIPSFASIGYKNPAGVVN